jgi:hypothetical protein
MDAAGQEITQKAVEAVQIFFADRLNDDAVSFPAILQDSGVWMAVFSDEALGIYFLNERQQERINACRQQGRHPFPGFMIGEARRPADYRAAFGVMSPFRFYSGKRSNGAFAFSLTREASCVVIDHVHEIIDGPENKESYPVDLAYLLGYGEKERWGGLEPRLSALLDYSLDLWKKTGN